MKKLSTFIAAASLVAGSLVTAAKTVHTIGDSTMANYDESATVTRGWGQYLGQYLTGVTTNNRAKSGSSSKSFYNDAAYWPSVKKQMKEGDIVVISFAHNDEKNGGMDGDALRDWYIANGQQAQANAADTRGTEPSTTFKDYLRKYVNDTRAAGCTPILCGPICRMYFTGNTIRRNGRHDLGDSFSVLTANGPVSGKSVAASDHSMDYAYQMKMVAQEMNVPYVDLTTATADLYLSYGDADCHSILGDGDGSTHLSATGAALIARRFAQLCQEQGLLEGHINLASDLSVYPDNADLGKGYTGQSLTKEFMLSGFDLTPAAGSVSVTASGSVELSTDKTTWSKSVSISYKGGSVVDRFYARLTLDKNGAYNETITVKAGNKTTTIPVTAEAVVLGEGTEVTAYWRLENDDKYTLEGPALVIDESWHQMFVQRYSAPNANTVWPAGTGFDASRKTQRNLIEGEVWPAGEIDEVSTRYIEFGITAVEGTTLNIDRISYYMCGCGGNGMCVKVYYSTDDDFANPVNIAEYKKMPANNMIDGSVTPVISLEGGKSCRLRFYPWYDGTANAKTFCLSDVKFHGYATTGSGVASIDADAIPVATEYYNVQGIKIADPADGLYIVKTVMSDGSVKVNKQIF